LPRRIQGERLSFLAVLRILRSLRGRHDRNRPRDPGQKSGVALVETSPIISVDALRALLEEIAVLPLAARRQIAGLPAARADVFPTALTTTLAVAEIGRFTSFRHSFHNLRFGIAAELLQM